MPPDNEGQISNMAQPENSLERKPRDLARNAEQRFNQLSLIATKPSEHQIKQVISRLSSESPDIPASRAHAENVFNNLADTVSAKSQADREVKNLRREALGAPREEFKEKLGDLREAERRRRELDEDVRSIGSFLKEAGVQLEPDQAPLSMGEKVQAGVRMGAETTRDKIGQMIDSGRSGLKDLLGLGVNTLQVTKSQGEAGFKTIVDSAKTGATVGSEKAGGLMSRLTGVGKSALERGAKTITAGWETAVVWGESVVDTGAAATTGVADVFKNKMKLAGEAARSKWDKVSQSIYQFAGEQAMRVHGLETQIKKRVGDEISMRLEKAKILLAPAWESVQKERTVIQERNSMLVDKLGIIVDGVSDLANPLIDRILDQGRDIRDGALGLGRKPIEGMRVFGKTAIGVISEKASPAYDFLSERWEDLRLRSNEGRKRLNLFLNGTLGNAGERFKMLPESAGKAAERAKLMLSGMKVEGGKIVQNGKEVPKEVSAWFAHQAAAAGEVVKNSKEKITGSIEMLRRYWEVYAVSKWNEAGLSKDEVARRLKVMRAAGAASMGRAAAVGVATAVEGVVLASKMVRDPRGRLLLGGAALALALAANPDLANNIQDLMQSVGTNIPSVDIGSMLSNIPKPDLGVFSNPDISPLADTAGPSPGPDLSPPASAPDLSSTDLSPGSQSVQIAPDLSSSLSADVPAPETAVAPVELPNIIPGQPVESQLPPDVLNSTAEYNRVVGDILRANWDNFFTTSRAIVDNPNMYTPTEVATAQRALDAMTKLSADTSTIAPDELKGLIQSAAHYWRPNL